MNELKTVGVIVSSAAAAELGTISVATITSSAPGVLGVLGFTTTTTVALPIAGVFAVAGLIGYGVYKGTQAARSN